MSAMYDRRADRLVLYRFLPYFLIEHALWLGGALACLIAAQRAGQAAWLLGALLAGAVAARRAQQYGGGAVIAHGPTLTVRRGFLRAREVQIEIDRARISVQQRALGRRCGYGTLSLSDRGARVSVRAVARIGLLQQIVAARRAWDGGQPQAGARAAWLVYNAARTSEQR